MKPACPVLIVGAGPVGLVLAIELARRGVAFRVIDKSLEATPESRAAAIWPRTMEVFASLGIIKAALAGGLQLNGMRFAAGKERLFRLDFNGVHSPYAFGLAIPQNTTEELLGERLATFDQTVERGCDLIGLTEHDDHIEAHVVHEDGSTEVIEASWLVGCDGAHSAVRKAMGLSFDGSAYPERWALGDVQLDAPLPKNEGMMFLGKGGPVGFIPFKEAGRYRVFTPLPKSFPLTESATFGGPDELPLKEFENLVRRRVPLRPLIMSQAKWLAVFRVHRRSVEQMRVRRIFVAGDAAHIQSPAGGQGMNTGIQDAFNLGWKLAFVVKGQAKEALLDSYHAERHPVFVDTARKTDRLLKALSLKNPMERWFFTSAAKQLMRLKKIRQLAAETMSEVLISYPDSPIVRDQWSLKAAPAPGERAPEVALPRDGRHVVLVFSGSPYQLHAAEALQREIAVMRAAWGEFAEVRLISTDDQTTHKAFGADFSSLFIVRPDGHIGLRSRVVTAAAVDDYFTMAVGLIPGAGDKPVAAKARSRAKDKIKAKVEPSDSGNEVLLN